MHLKCPQCEFSREIPEEKIPARAQMATCPKCGHKFQFRELNSPEENISPSSFSEQEQTQQESAPENGQENDIWSKLESLSPQEADEESFEESGPQFSKRTKSQEEVPWEELDKNGFFPGLANTIRRVLFKPSDFFRSMPLGGGLIKPLVFYLIISEVQALAQFFWQMAGLLSAPEMSGRFGGMVGVGMTGIGSLLILIFYPILLAVMLFLISGINHFCLNALKAASRGFEGTFRVLSYSSAPMILSVFPIIGPLAGAIWTFICTILGFKNMHRTTVPKVILAMLVAGFIFLLINIPILLMSSNQV